MRTDSRESFESWARSRQPELLRAAWWLTGDFQRAEDLVQEALLTVALRWDRLRHENLDGWVRTVIYRRNISWWRRTQNEVLVEAVPDAPETVLAVETWRLLEPAFQALTVRQRAVVWLRLVEDLSVADAATILGVSEGTVKKQMSLARERLRTAHIDLVDDWSSATTAGEQS